MLRSIGDERQMRTDESNLIKKQRQVFTVPIRLTNQTTPVSISGLIPKFQNIQNTQDLTYMIDSIRVPNKFYNVYPTDYVEIAAQSMWFNVNEDPVAPTNVHNYIDVTNIDYMKVPLLDESGPRQPIFMSGDELADRFTTLIRSIGGLTLITLYNAPATTGFTNTEITLANVLDNVQIVFDSATGKFKTEFSVVVQSPAATVQLPESPFPLSPISDWYVAYLVISITPSRDLTAERQLAINRMLGEHLRPSTAVPLYGTLNTMTMAFYPSQIIPVSYTALGGAPGTAAYGVNSLSAFAEYESDVLPYKELYIRSSQLSKIWSQDGSKTNILAIAYIKNSPQEIASVSTYYDSFPMRGGDSIGSSRTFLLEITDAHNNNVQPLEPIDIILSFIIE